MFNPPAPHEIPDSAGEQNLGRVAHDVTPVSRAMYEPAAVVATRARGR